MGIYTLGTFALEGCALEALEATHRTNLGAGLSVSLPFRPQKLGRHTCPFELTCAARLSHPCVSSRARVEAGQRSDASDASLVGSLRYHGAETRLRRLIATNVTSLCISKAKMSRVMWRRWQNLIAMPNTCRSTACCRLPQRKVQNKTGSYTTNQCSFLLPSVWGTFGCAQPSGRALLSLENACNCQH